MLVQWPRPPRVRGAASNGSGRQARGSGSRGRGGGRGERADAEVLRLLVRLVAVAVAGHGVDGERALIGGAYRPGLAAGAGAAAVEEVGVAQVVIVGAGRPPPGRR